MTELFGAGKSAPEPAGEQTAIIMPFWLKVKATERDAKIAEAEEFMRCARIVADGWPLFPYKWVLVSIEKGEGSPDDHAVVGTMKAPFRTGGDREAFAEGIRTIFRRTNAHRMVAATEPGWHGLSGSFPLAWALGSEPKGSDFVY